MSKFISPLTWPGGKAKQWNLIKSYFPKNTDELNYVEPFFGGSSVGLNSLRENLFNYYFFNDIDSSLMQFWKWLIKLKTDNSFDDIVNQIPFFLFYPIANLNKLKSSKMISSNKNLEFLVNNNLTFNGQRWGTWTQMRLEQNWNSNKRDRIDNCFDLLKNNQNKIKFFNEDYIKIFNYTLHNKSFYYLDPPYFSNKGKPYKYRFNKDNWIEFQILLEKITNEESLFCLSIDDCLETREMFKDYFIYEQEWKYTSSNTKGNKKCKMGKELIITNYEVKNINEN